MSELVELGRECLIDNGIDLLGIGEESFEHHGILGQKWGIRRFQNKDGSLTDEGRKRYSEMNDDEKKEYRDSAVKSGDVKKLVEVKDDLTNQELQQGLQRINLNKQLSDVAFTEEKDAGEKQIRKLTQYMQTGTTLINKAVDMYDAFDKIKKRYSEWEKSDLQDDVDNGRLKDVLNNPDATAKDIVNAKRNAKDIAEAKSQLKEQEERDNFYEKEKFREAVDSEDVKWLYDNYKKMNKTQRKEMFDAAKWTSDIRKWRDTGKMSSGKDNAITQEKFEEMLETAKNNGVI